MHDPNTSLSYDPLPPTGEQMCGAGSLAGLTYYASNEEDPYITLKDVVKTLHSTHCALVIIILSIPPLPNLSLLSLTSPSSP